MHSNFAFDTEVAWNARGHDVLDVGMHPMFAPVGSEKLGNRQVMHDIAQRQLAPYRPFRKAFRRTFKNEVRRQRGTSRAGHDDQSIVLSVAQARVLRADGSIRRK